MIASDEFDGGRPSLGDLDADSSLADFGTVELHGLEHDMDGDGILDTLTVSTDDAMIVLTDADLDGAADHVTVVEHDGDFAAWELRHVEGSDVTWERTDHGKLGG